MNLPLLHVNLPSTIMRSKKDAFQNCPFLLNIDASPLSTPGVIDLEKSFREFLGIGCSYDDLHTWFGGLPSQIL
jgi:hypothetical protein